MKQKYKCEFITQGREEPASDFAERIARQVNSIIKIYPTMLGAPMCFPTSAADGRKEVMIQWYVKDEESELTPTSLLALAFELGNRKEAVIEVFAKENCIMPEETLDLTNGYELCIKTILEIFPELKDK